MHLDDFNEFMAANQHLPAPTTPPSKETMALVRQMPGKPPREMSINHLMKHGGLTRAQAKERLRQHDIILGAELERRQRAVKDSAEPTLSSILDGKRPNATMAAAIFTVTNQARMRR